MTMQPFPGRSVAWGGLYDGFNDTTPAFVGPVIDATGKMLAFVGRVFFHSRTGTKAIRKVGFRFGAVTKAGGSALTVSLQTVNAAAGPPMQPDEVQDQTVAIANADAGFASNVWYQTGSLNADRTVAFGELLAIVIEFDGGGRLGADSVAIAGLATAQTGPSHQSMTVLKSGSWAVQQIVPNVILEFSDGSFGTLFGAFPCSAVSSVALTTATTPDEVALEMTWPGPVQIDGVGMLIQTNSAAADGDVVLYTGTTATRTKSLLAEHSMASAATRPIVVPFDTTVDLAANTTYRMALKPTTTTAISLYYFEVANANHFQAHVGGPGWAYTARVDAGSWDSPTTTRRPFIWPYVSGIDDALTPGSPGGGLIAGRLIP